MRKLEVKRERRFLPHLVLLGAAYTFLKDAAPEAKRLRASHYELGAIIFSALAFEALANAFGERLITDWEDSRRASPIAKLRVVCTHLKVDARFDRQPWSTALWLIKFRNKVAHAKPQFVKKNKLMSSEEFEKKGHDRPTSKIEAQVTYVNAKRSVEAVMDIGYALIKHLSPEEYAGLVADGWTVSATVKNEEH